MVICIHEERIHPTVNNFLHTYYPMLHEEYWSDILIDQNDCEYSIHILPIRNSQIPEVGH